MALKQNWCEDTGLEREDSIPFKLGLETVKLYKRQFFFSVCSLFFCCKCV